MTSRFLLIAGVAVTFIGIVDPASARPRRKLARPATEVTPASSAPTESLRQVVYPVADLVIPVPSRDTLEVAPLPGPRPVPDYRPGAAQTRTEIMGGRPSQTQERELIELVSSTVMPASWRERGGRGSIQYYPLEMSLVVNQTPAVHEEVHSLLAALRRLQDVQTTVEVRVVTAAPEAFQRASRELKLTRLDEKQNQAVHENAVVGPRGTRWTALLDQERTLELLTQLQADRRTAVMQAPRMTLFDAQKSALSATEHRILLTSAEIFAGDTVYFTPKHTEFTTGLRLGLESVVAADRRNVRVQMKGYWCQPTGPMELQPVQIPVKARNEDGTQETRPFQMMLQKPRFAQVRLDQNLEIPDGEAALIYCGVVPMEVAPDLTARFSPFKQPTTSADRCVFLLVTPRIVVQEELEARDVARP